MFSGAVIVAALAELAVGAEAAPMTAQPDSLQLQLVAPAGIQPGAPIRFTLRVRNQTERTLDLYLRGRTATFDVVITRGPGEVVWQRLEGEIIPAIVHLRVLQPGERLELTATWDRRTKSGSTIAPGRYTVQALLLAEGDPLTTPRIELVIPEP